MSVHRNERGVSALLVRRTFFVLNLCLHIQVDGVRGLDFSCDRLAGERLDGYLHTATEKKDKMESRHSLDVVVGKSSTVLSFSRVEIIDYYH